jgi:hypothetical protein
MTRTVNEEPVEREPLRPLRGVLPQEAGEDLARAIEEMFPIEQ